ncbi:hypothetical protein BLA50215_06055 [Burkholderia lata]|uniref:DUF6402 family protein n=1 Tax=Burkholderia lata (strain ATCC 17760 / DSM 23089 / LMG 22485 / NCIMB 9086 / R18194 / 383) TaxID=482957 RepID=UPI0014537647|nr:DUF6402 family protein [Burkholderia lata]VWD49867.1 hypothetical protein BLA50215_06055 [Burkholderia lata]
MADVKKVPYYKPQKGLFGSGLKEYQGARGCVPLETQKGVSLDRLAPGEKPPPPLPKPTPKAPSVPTQGSASDPLPKTDQAMVKEPPKPPDAEVCENPPPFDLQDVPIAMDNLGWKVSAKLARIWFASPAHTYNDNATSIQPLNDRDVTLDWALKFGSVRRKYEKLLKIDIYRDAAIDLAKTKIFNRIKKRFLEERGTNLGFNTDQSTKDILQFHIDWQFQFTAISDWDTLENLAPTDLTGALANFNIYAALGNVEISGEKYFRYEKTSNIYCTDAVGKITHIYVYIKDNYSFNSRQYLGHWNKHGVIIAPGSLLTGSSSPKRDSDIDIWAKNINRLVDTRKGLFGKFKEPDVYYPIYNGDYSHWREKHHQGGDLMIYSKPAYVKLNKPIELQLGEICRLEPSDTLV